MSISPGSRLGPYEILAPIGAGGMGEVWRARDPRLGRDVAISSPELIFLNVNPAWDDLHWDPRFVNLLKRLHLPNEHAQR